MASHLPEETTPRQRSNATTLNFGQFTYPATADRPAETGNVTVLINHAQLRLLISRAFRNRTRRAEVGGKAFQVLIAAVIPPEEVQTLPPAAITEPAPEPS